MFKKLKGRGVNPGCSDPHTDTSKQSAVYSGYMERRRGAGWSEAHAQNSLLKVVSPVKHWQDTSGSVAILLDLKWSPLIVGVASLAGQHLSGRVVSQGGGVWKSDSGLLKA